jgi:hypothetical protein
MAGAAGANELSIDDILAFFDDSIEAGTLVGEGPGKSGKHRHKALRNMLASSGNLLDEGLVDAACDQLLDALERTDDRFPPPDFVSGEAAIGLSDLILTLRIGIGCDIVILAAGEGGSPPARCRSKRSLALVRRVRAKSRRTMETCLS